MTATERVTATERATERTTEVAPTVTGPPAGPLRSAVVINPSKVEDLEGRRHDICAALAEEGWPAPLWLETTPDDPGCGQTQQAINEGVDLVFACGGDGTVMACVGALAGTDVALAVLPSGTGNLLAANLGLSSDVVEGIAVATRGARRRIDVGVVENRTFAVMAGIGFDAEMLRSTPEPLKRRFGWPAYAFSALKHLRTRPMRVSISLDGATNLRRRAKSVLVGNVGRIQGGIPLLPDAQPDDGYLDVAILSPRTLTGWVSLAWGVVRRKHGPAPIETYRAKRVEITADRVYQRELDGDVINAGRSMVVDIRANALTLCVPSPEPDMSA
ncbi:MAG TPA: YegS/Rv2252/BmrU family lipid kinase [Micromonosporaceae bacterium]|nr:YegS/Rv2252/BmrU family lipid kinase [Micromonosporaceae bacterium]